MSDFEFEIKEIITKKIKIRATSSVEALREAWIFYEEKKKELEKILSIIEVEINQISEQKDLFE